MKKIKVIGRRKNEGMRWHNSKQTKTCKGKSTALHDWSEEALDARLAEYVVLSTSRAMKLVPYFLWGVWPFKERHDVKLLSKQKR